MNAMHHHSHPPKIGALVGMGPNSTAPFYNALIQYARQFDNAQQDQDFPEIVMISIPMPFTINHGTDYHTVMTKLQHGITLLNQCQVDVVAIPCNTVHEYYDQLQTACNSPIIHIAEATLSTLDEQITGPTALLATPYTIQAGIYQDRMRTKGLPYYHSEALQALVNHLITSLKAAPQSTQTHTAWQAVLDYLEQHQIRQAIIGCTDISPYAQQQPGKVHWVDSTDALAKQTIERYLTLK